MAIHEARQTNEPSWTVRLGLGLLGVLVGIAVVVYSTVYFGVTTGEEFCPETVERRTFNYYEIPLIGVLVSPINRADKTGELEQLLTSQKIIPVKKAVQPKQARWDLVFATRGNAVSNLGDARILCRYFDAVDGDDKEVWLAWTKEHRELAKILWPAVVDLAQQELYIFIPDLMRLAERGCTPAQFTAALDNLLASKYFRLAQNQQSLGRHEQAIELYSLMLVHSPGRIEALEGRAESLKSVSELGESQAEVRKTVNANK